MHTFLVTTYGSLTIVVVVVVVGGVVGVVGVVVVLVFVLIFKKRRGGWLSAPRPNPLH